MIMHIFYSNLPSHSYSYPSPQLQQAFSRKPLPKPSRKAKSPSSIPSSIADYMLQLLLCLLLQFLGDREGLVEYPVFLPSAGHLSHFPLVQPNSCQPAISRNTFYAELQVATNIKTPKNLTSNTQLSYSPKNQRG